MNHDQAGKCGSVTARLIAAGIACGVGSARAVPPVPSVGPDTTIAAGTTSLQLSQPAVAVTKYSPTHATELMIGWSTWSYFGSALQYSNIGAVASLNNGTIFVPLSFPLVACPDTHGTHAMVAVSAQSGDLWIGGSSNLGLSVARKPYGVAGLDPTILVECGDESRRDPFMSIGPFIDTSTPETMYVSYHGFLPQGGQTMKTIRCKDTAPLGTDWNPSRTVVSGETSTSDCGPRSGYGPYPVVIPAGTNTGRLILASGSPPNMNIPAEVTYSDHGGGQNCEPFRSWAHFIPLDHFGVSNIQIFPADNTLISSEIFVTSNPSVAIDPRSMASSGGDPTPATVYAIFTGRPATDPTNHDLFVAISTDSGTTFPASTTIRLTETQLGLPYGTPQWMPAIEVDEFGGINLLFATLIPTLGTDFVDALEKIRYCRWRNASDMAAGVLPFTYDVSGVFRPWANEHANTPAAGNDYHMLKASGCNVHMAFAVRNTSGPDPIWEIHYRRVVVGLCRADMIPNGVIGTEDFEAYLDAYIDGAPDADMDGDELVTTGDFDTFADAYCDGCTVPN